MPFPMILLFACFFIPHVNAADVPVSEIRLEAGAAQKTDFAYKEMQRAEWNLEAAEREAAEADRAHRQAQRQADEAAQRLAAARQKAENARTTLQQARKKWEGMSQQLGNH